MTEQVKRPAVSLSALATTYIRTQSDKLATPFNHKILNFSHEYNRPLMDEGNIALFLRHVVGSSKTITFFHKVSIRRFWEEERATLLSTLPLPLPPP